MKYIKDIILGVMIGATVFVSLVVAKPLIYEYSHQAVADDIEADPFFNSVLYEQIKAESSGKILFIPKPGYANQNVLDDLFSQTYGNLYSLMFWFGTVDPEEDALVELANSYNITPLEAKDILGGAIEPVLNLLPSYGKNLTQHEILYTASEIRREFEETYEIYQLKQELGSSAYISEVFSNGDLVDSGFDLVHDLDEIESVLFDVVTPVESVALGTDKDLADEAGMKESPYQPEDVGKPGPEFSQAYYALELNDQEEAEESLEEFDPSSLVEYTDEDVCPEEEDPLVAAISDYEQEAEEYFEENPPPEEPTEEEQEAAKKEEEEKTLAEKLVPEEPADFRRKEQCNGVLLFGNNLTDPVQTEGNVKTETTTKSGVPIAEAVFYICLEYSEKWETYKSYVPAAPCLTCEFEKILAYMEKTLSSSLVPSKLTGNLMESSLCKKKLLGALNIDINFNIVWAPIETPPNDDTIYGKSIFEEWDKFVNKNHPFLLEIDGKPLGHSLLPEHITTMSTEWVKQNTSDTSDLEEVFSEITLMQEQLTNEAAENVEKYQVSTAAEDFAAYSEGVMEEVGQMKEYFKVFSDHFQKISEEEGFCKTITTKQTCE